MSLDFYWKLASDDADTRVQAAVGLLNDLNTVNTEESWTYAFNRLIRGLSSSNGSSRIGFSMALTEVLQAQAESITLYSYIDTLLQHTKVMGNVSGHEERGLNFGRLFGLKVVVASDLLTRDSTNIEELIRLVEIILELATKKAWLRESCFFELCEILQRLASVNKDVDRLYQFCVDQVESLGLTLTSEGVALYLSIPAESRKKYGDKYGWKEGNPLAKGSLTLLAKALKESDHNEDSNGTANGKAETNKQKGSWKPKLHFVWSKLLTELQNNRSAAEQQVDHLQSPKPKSKKHKSKHGSKPETGPKNGPIGLEEFWKIVVDESLFSSTSSSERKFWGFEVFELFLRSLDISELATIFSPNLLRCLINQLSQQDRFLNKAAKRVLSTLLECSKSRPEIIPVVLEQLLTGKNAVPNFDRITKTKTVEELLKLAGPKDLLKIAHIYLGVFLTPVESSKKDVEQDLKTVDINRQWALDSLVNLVRNQDPKNLTDSSNLLWIDDVLETVVNYAFFKVREPTPVPELSQKAIDLCQSRLSSLMSSTVDFKRQDGKQWAYKALEIILENEVDKTGRFEPRIQFEGELLKAKEKAVKTVEKIRKKRLASPHADNSQLEAFELLFSLVLLQVYMVDDEAVSILGELQLCYNSILGKARIQEGAEDEEMDASQILTEILLSFMSRQSNLLRKLSETVWETFASKITEASLGLLYDVSIHVEVIERLMANKRFCKQRNPKKDRALYLMVKRTKRMKMRMEMKLKMKMKMKMKVKMKKTMRTTMRMMMRRIKIKIMKMMMTKKIAMIKYCKQIELPPKL